MAQLIIRFSYLVLQIFIYIGIFAIFLKEKLEGKARRGEWKKKIAGHIVEKCPTYFAWKIRYYEFVGEQIVVWYPTKNFCSLKIEHAAIKAKLTKKAIDLLFSCLFLNRLPPTSIKLQ